MLSLVSELLKTRQQLDAVALTGGLPTTAAITPPSTEDKKSKQSEACFKADACLDQSLLDDSLLSVIEALLRLKKAASEALVLPHGLTLEKKALASMYFWSVSGNIIMTALAAGLYKSYLTGGWNLG